MFLQLPRDLLVTLAAKLAFSDFLKLSTLSKAHQNLLNEVDLWKRYLKQFNLAPSVIQDPYWDQFTTKQYKKFCSNYLNFLMHQSRSLGPIEMLDIVVLTDDFNLLQTFCLEQTIPLDSNLLERIASYAPSWILINFLEKENVPITKKAVVQFFTQDDITVTNFAIECAFTKGITDSKLFNNNRALYIRELMKEIVCNGSITAVTRLLELGYSVIERDTFKYVASKIRLSLFEYLIENNVLHSDAILLSECAYVGRIDLVFSLAQKRKLQATETTLRSLSRQCSLEEVKEFIKYFRIFPAKYETVEVARTNKDPRVAEYIESLTNNYVAVQI